MPGDFPKATWLDQGLGQGPCCSGVQYHHPLCRLLLCKSQSCTCLFSVGIRGGGCANWPGTGVAGGRRGRTQGPASGGRGQVPLLFQGLLSSLTLQTAKHTTFCGHRGLFKLFISAQSAHLPSLYIWPCPFPKGPANTGPPRRPCWLGQGPTALVQLIFQALLSGSIHFTIGTWSRCILGESKGKPCSISMMVL